MLTKNIAIAWRYRRKSFCNKKKYLRLLTIEGTKDCRQAFSTL